MMNLTEEQYQKVYDMAYACMPLRDIASALGLNYQMMRVDLRCEDSDVFKAYRSAKSLIKYNIYKKRRDLALEGDANALEQCRMALADMEDDE